MPLFVTKYERRDGTDRDALGRAALTLCRANRAIEGVRNSRFYWANTDTVAVLTDAEAGSYGQGSGTPPTADGAKAFFGMADLARQVSDETWGEAAAGEEVYRLSQ